MDSQNGFLQDCRWEKAETGSIKIEWPEASNRSRKLIDFIWRSRFNRLHSQYLLYVPGGLGRRRGKFLIRSFGQLAGFRARFLCNKCANNYMLSNVVGALYALFTSVLMYYLVQDPLGTKSGASKIANKNKQICLIYYDCISLRWCKVWATYLYLAWER